MILEDWGNFQGAVNTVMIPAWSGGWFPITAHVGDLSSGEAIENNYDESSELMCQTSCVFVYLVMLMCAFKEYTA